MRLTKYFSGVQGIDRKINAWVREKPKQRNILQIVSHHEGVLVVYEKASRQDAWESVKRGFAKKSKRQSDLI